MTHTGVECGAVFRKAPVLISVMLWSREPRLGEGWRDKWADGPTGPSPTSPSANPRISKGLCVYVCEML